MKQIFLLSFVLLFFSCKKESTNVSFTQVFGIQDYEKLKKNLECMSIMELILMV